MIKFYFKIRKKSAVKSVNMVYCEYAYLVNIKTIHTKMWIEYESKFLGWNPIYKLKKVKRVAIDD